MNVHLQDGLYRLCREKILQDNGYRISAADLKSNRVDESIFREYRDYRLRVTIKHAYENSIFYRKLFDSHSIAPSDVQSVGDLAKLPITEPKDLVCGSYDFLCVSQGNVDKQVTFLSSGTTGIKKKVFFSAEDVRNILKFLSVGMNSVVQRGATVHIMLPNTHGRGIGDLLGNSLKLGGFNPYVTELEWTSEKQIELIKEKKPDVIFGNARSIYRITKEMKNSVELSKMGVSVIFLTMEHASDAMVQSLKESWKCRVCMHYGLAEMGWGLAVECEHAPGYHYNEMDVIAEILDPITGKNIENGEEGELVFTSLGREAMPLIRYRSRDIATLTNGTCECGRKMQRIGFVKKRMESAVTLKNGIEITPLMLDEILYSFEKIIDYSVQIEHRIDWECMIFEIEMLESEESYKDKIRKGLNEFCISKAGLGVPDIRFLEKGALHLMCTSKKMIHEVTVM